MIKIKNLYFSYAKEYFTLNNVNFSLKHNEKAIIVGGKNSGKTSLVRILLGLDRFQKGEVLINNVDVKKINFKNDISVGYIPMQPPFMENKTVEENIKYIIKLREKKKDKIEIKLNNSLGHYSLFNIKNVKVNILNYYDKIKLALARLYVRNLDLIIVDDIFAGLNDNEAEDIAELIKELIKNNNNCTCVIFAENYNIRKYFDYKTYKLELGSLIDESVENGENLWV